MKRTIKAYGRSKDGKLEIANLDAVNQRIVELFKEDKPLEITIAGQVESKTQSQNGYFHGEILNHYKAALRGAGWDSIPFQFGNIIVDFPMNVDNLKTLLYAELGVRVLENGEFVPIKAGKATKFEMSELIDAAIVHMKNFYQYTVPPPDRNYKKAKETK